ncbi:ubiquitin carboxyl-terminal hydrolase 34, partial [Diplogelasinospora grovesii]
MAQASRTDESRERAVSSEPCSTRPNPFDDSDISSRKRRRTSMGGTSRSRSAETVNSDRDSATIGDSGLESSRDESAMKIDTDPANPTTPEQQPVELHPPSGPRSSRVTINVRTPSRPLEVIPSSPPSPKTDDVKISVEESEIDMAREDTVVETPASSPSDASSPTIELVMVQPDDDADLDGGQPAITILDEPRSILADPSAAFPFHDQTETYPETIARLTQYLVTHETVAHGIAEWIDNYLAFAKSSPYLDVVESYQEHRELWHSLPEMVMFMTNRKMPYPRPRVIRQAIFNFFRAFAKLTAFFVEFDVKALRQRSTTELSRLPDLVSPFYVLALGSLTRREEVTFHTAQVNNVEEEWSYAMEMILILDEFQGFHTNHSGTLAYIKQLAQTEAELVSRFPKLTDYLGHICVLVNNMMHQCYRKAQGGHQHVADQAKANISRGYALFKAMSAALSAITEKHINHLSYDGASSLILALTDIYQICLATDRVVPLDVIKEHRQKHKPVPPQQLPEAMAYHWRFTEFRKLIMSSQMQLRVMAVTVMCNDLVAFYRKYSDAADEPSPLFLEYMAEFLLDTGLVAYILGPTCHPEITIESSNIVGFLVVSRTYEKAHTDALWQTVTSTQDPRVSDALIRMTTRTTNLHTHEQLVYFCEKLNTIPIEAFSSTMRDFCDQVYRHMLTKFGFEKPMPESAPYELAIRLIRQSSTYGSQSAIAYPDIQQFAIQKFRDLLGSPMTTETRRNIYADCLSDIAQKSPTVLGSLWVLFLMIRPAAGRELRTLNSDHNLTELLVDELEAAIPKARSAGFPAIISGPHNTPRKELIAFLLNHDPSTITKDLGSKLWHLLVGGGAACREDRDVAWQLLNNSLKRASGNTAFISTCFSEYLPTLSPDCFCPGALDFVREGVLPQVNNDTSIFLDDEDTANRAGIEQLWRMVLNAPEGTIERQAIQTLVNDVYVNSRSILSYPHYRALKVHLALVDRCLKQLSSAAAKLKGSSNGTKNGEDECMDIVATEMQVHEQELLFIRSLFVLSEFHRLHQAQAHFSAPDLRSLILDSPKGIEGDSAELKYQSFDGDKQTDVKPLSIGKRNTAASLLASLRDATGFSNYRVYYRGRQLVPLESELSRPLEELQIQNGILLVKREAEVENLPTRIRPGASQLEMEILGHFEELWDYLTMHEKLAQEMYSFLVRLPADENMLGAIDNPNTPNRDIFPVGQPFKSLYAIHTLREYLRLKRRMSAVARPENQADASNDNISAALLRAMSLVVSAILDQDVIAQCPSQELQIGLSSSLVDCFVCLLKDPLLPASAVEFLDTPLLDRLLSIISSMQLANTPNSTTKNLNLCLQSIFEPCLISSVFMSAFCGHDRIPALLEDLLLNDERLEVRQQTAVLILEKCGISQTKPDEYAERFRAFFWPLVSGLVRPAIAKTNCAAELLDLCFTMFKMLRVAKSDILDIQKLLVDWGRLFLGYTTLEDVTQPDLVDHAAYSLIQLIHSILCWDEYPAPRELLHFKDMARKIFWRHLFPRIAKDGKAAATRPILHSQSRVMLIEIIFSLIGEDRKQLMWLIEDLNELVPVYPDEDVDFYSYDLPQQFERAKAIRASCGYVGLKNLSNTCYLNSLFTQLFMNPDFRQFMLRARVQDRDYSQNLLWQTQKLFAFMQGSMRRFMNPEECVACIKTYEDMGIDIHNQMDVDEFYNLLFDRWEGQLLTAEEKRQFRSFYGGQLVQQVASKECEHVSERLEPFSAIQCDIKGKSSLEESLQAYVDGEIMEGGSDNKYKCSTCDRHVDAVKRACLKDIPDNLIFHLKRFDFNLRTLQRSKINDYFTFPSKVDMRPYTIEHLSNPTEDQPEDVFELVGILVHSGTAESGHYYSYVRERPSNSNSEVWVEFNDDIVSQWDPAQMENSCFGGPDYRSHFENNGVLYDKTYSAYMLFYQRSSSLARKQEVLRQSAQPSPMRVGVPQELEEFIQDENTQILRRHCLYDPCQIQFVQMALYHARLINQGECSSNHAMENVAITMALSHLDQVASRAKDIPNFADLAKRLNMMSQDCVKCSLAVFEYFRRYLEPMRLLIQRNPDSEVRQTTANLIIRALEVIKAQLPLQYGLPPTPMSDDVDEIDFGLQPSVLLGMMRIFKTLWDGFHINLRSWHEVFDFMLAFVRMGRHEMAAFLETNYFKQLIMIIWADLNHELPAAFIRMLQTVSRRTPSRPPSYESIIDLLDVLIGSCQFVYTDRGDDTGIDSPKQRGEHPEDLDRPFVYTRLEARHLQTDYTRGGANMFMDKLIAIDQNPNATYSILASLMRQSRTMEDKLYNTLRTAISGQITQHHVTPYLRVASHVFCRWASRANMIDNFIGYICEQCMCLQGTEGRAFLDFQRAVFDGPRENSGESLDDIINAGYDNLPEWAPGLLGYYDAAVTSDVELFLKEKLFKYGPLPDLEDSEQGKKRADKMVETARELGIKCLRFLQDNYVARRVDVSTRLVAALERTIKECSKYFNLKEPGEDEFAREFLRLSQSKFDLSNDVPLRRLTVEELEEDGSGTLNSDSCSIASS